MGKKSKRRNETIADLFSRLEYVEKLGTGISKMRQWMKSCGLKPPKIESNGFFTITFERLQRPAKDVHKMSIKDVHKMSIKNISKAERKSIILERIRAKNFHSPGDIARELGVTIKTIYRDIDELKMSNKIKYVGSKRSGRYELL